MRFMLKPPDRKHQSDQGREVQTNNPHRQSPDEAHPCLFPPVCLKPSEPNETTCSHDSLIFTRKAFIQTSEGVFPYAREAYCTGCSKAFNIRHRPRPSDFDIISESTPEELAAIFDTFGEIISLAEAARLELLVLSCSKRQSTQHGVETPQP